MLVKVARIGKPHGLRGENTIEVITDSPDERLTSGATFIGYKNDNTSSEPFELTIGKIRKHKGTTLIQFMGTEGLVDAEKLRDVTLYTDSSNDVSQEDAYYEHEIKNFQVLTLENKFVGVVKSLNTKPAQDLIEVEAADKSTFQIPFVKNIVVEVNPQTQKIIIDPPNGLVELNNSSNNSEQNKKETDQSHTSGTSQDQDDSSQK